MSDEAPAKKKRFRSPPYPSFDLGRAVERVTLLDKVAQHHEVGVGVLSEAWGMKSADGQVWRSAAALIQYGLVTDSGTGKTRKFKITDPARRIVRDPNPDSEKRRSALKSAALLPTIHNTLWERFGAANEVSDSVIKAYLTLDRLDEGETPYSDSAAEEVISSFRKSLEFADLTNADSIQSDSEDAVNTADHDVVVPPDTSDDDVAPTTAGARNRPIAVRVGDFVQWESQGMMQFEHPKRVRWVSDDGMHLAVDGSNTGIAVDQVSVEKAPTDAKPPPIQQPPAATTMQQTPAATNGSDLNSPSGQTGVPTISMSDDGLVISEGVISSLGQFEQLMKRLQAGKMLLEDE